MRKFVLYNTIDSETVTMTLPQVLEEINRDRSNSWIDCDESDFREGLDQFTEYVIIKEYEE